MDEHESIGILSDPRVNLVIQVMGAHHVLPATCTSTVYKFRYSSSGTSVSADNGGRVLQLGDRPKKFQGEMRGRLCGWKATTDEIQTVTVEGVLHVIHING